MSIDIIGEPDVLEALGVPNNQAGKFTETRLDNLINAVKSPEPIATIEIPDVRNQALGSTQPERSVAENDADAINPVTGLDAIKRAIEKTLESDPEVAIEELQAALELPKLDNTDAAATIHQPASTTKRKKVLKSKSDCRLVDVQTHDPQIKPIIDSLLEKFPKDGTNIISFAGSEENSQLSTVISKSAVVLENASKASVLVVDFDAGNDRLTRDLGIASDPGILDMKRKSLSWAQVVQTTSLENIDIVSVGRIEKASNIPQTIRDTVGAISNDYNFVLVNVGDAHGAVAQAWAKHVQGTFLLVSMVKSNQEIAKSAVAQLNACGARLIGCVVSQMEEV